MQRHHGAGQALERLDPLRRRGAGRARAGRYRPPRHRLRAAGPAALALADGRRAPAAGRRRAPRRLDDPAHLRHLPAPGGAQVQCRVPALRRGAADARHLACPPAQSASAGDGRADRGPGARDRGAGRRHPGSSRRGRRDRRARHRAEHRRCHRRGRDRRHHRQRPHQQADRFARAGRRSRPAGAPARRWPPRARGHSRQRPSPHNRRGARRNPSRRSWPDAHLRVQSADADALVAAGADGADRSPSADELDCSVAHRCAVVAHHCLAVDGRQRPLCHRRRHARHQGRRAAPDLRDPQKQWPARASRRPLHKRQAVGCGRTADRDCAQPAARLGGSLYGRPGPRGCGHGAGIRSLDQAADERSRHHRRRRLGRHGDGGSRHARTAHRHPQSPHIDGGLRQCARLRRAFRHHDDVLGHRRAGAQLDFPAGALQRRAGDGRHGQGAAGRGAYRWAARGTVRAAGHRSHHVRRDHALRATSDPAARERLRLPGLPRHRHRRPVHGEARRLWPGGRGDRRDDDGGVRPLDGRHIPGNRGPLRRHHSRPPALCRLGRRPRHGDLRSARDRPGPLQGPQLLRSQSRRSL